MAYVVYSCEGLIGCCYCFCVVFREANIRSDFSYTYSLAEAVLSPTFTPAHHTLPCIHTSTK